MTEHRFVHNAMACEWELRVSSDDASEADHASRAVFEEIDRLELELSRFVESSDISRVNDLRAGESVIVGHDAFACLQRAKQLFEVTGGAFDIALGSGLEGVTLERATRTVTIEGDGLTLDLGGIGKGHAIDAALQELDNWDVESGLLTSGQSTVRAFGRRQPVAVRDPRDHDTVLARLSLDDRTFSGSGTLLHGQHIVDPQSGQPAVGPTGSWALARNSAISDALSTTFMIVSAEEIPAICQSLDAAAIWLTPEGELASCGEVPWLEPENDPSPSGDHHSGA